MTLDEILEEAEKICREENVESLYLFGSYAKGNATDTSDVDLFVKGAKNMAILRDKLENIRTLKKIDLVDYDNCRNESLKEAMDRYGKKIY